MGLVRERDRRWLDRLEVKVLSDALDGDRPRAGGGVTFDFPEFGGIF